METAAAAVAVVAVVVDVLVVGIGGGGEVNADLVSLVSFFSAWLSYFGFDLDFDFAAAFSFLLSLSTSNEIISVLELAFSLSQHSSCDDDGSGGLRL